MMSGIRGKNTQPELLVRRFLWKNGFRFRLHDRKLPGRPDIVLPKLKTVVEVRGCFWHGHTRCPLFRAPASNVEFWHIKIAGNRKRDRRNERALRALGWHQATVWECSLRAGSAARMQRLLRFLQAVAKSA